MGTEFQIIILGFQIIRQKIDPGEGFRGKCGAVMDKPQIFAVRIIFTVLHTVQHFTYVFQDIQFACTYFKLYMVGIV